MGFRGHRENSGSGLCSPDLQGSNLSFGAMCQLEAQVMYLLEGKARISLRTCVWPD
jgi:hypothetical protein